MLIILAFLCFAVAGLWHGILRSWPMALVCVGLALWVLDASGPLTVG